MSVETDDEATRNSAALVLIVQLITDMISVARTAEENAQLRDISAAQRHGELMKAAADRSTTVATHAQGVNNGAMLNFLRADVMEIRTMVSEIHTRMNQSRTVSLPDGRSLEVGPVRDHGRGESTATFRLDGEFVNVKFRRDSLTNGARAAWEKVRIPVLAAAMAISGHYFPKLLALLTAGTHQ